MSIVLCQHLLPRASNCSSPRPCSSSAGPARPLCRCQGHNRKPRRRQLHAQPEETEETDLEKELNFEGLLPEEDWEVPGGANDSISSNTKLGRAVNDACAELEALGKLEREQLEQANDLLRKLGISEDMLRPQPRQQDTGS